MAGAAFAGGSKAPGSGVIKRRKGGDKRTCLNYEKKTSQKNPGGGGKDQIDVTRQRQTLPEKARIQNPQLKESPKSQRGRTGVEMYEANGKPEGHETTRWKGSILKKLGIGTKIRQKICNRDKEPCCKKGKSTQGSGGLGGKKKLGRKRP